MYPEVALRRVARHYNRLPWELLDVPEDEIAFEYEMLDAEAEVADMAQEDAKRG